MDDTPKAFLEELRSSLLRKRVGQIALAVVLAEAAWRLVSSLTWYLIIPLIARGLRGNTESVLFAGSTNRPFPWENLFGSLLEFGSGRAQDSPIRVIKRHALKSGLQLHERDIAGWVRPSARDGLR